KFGPREAHPHRAAIVLVVTVELAAVAFEAPYHRRAQDAGSAAHPVDRPLTLPDVEGAKSQARPTLRREEELIDRGDTVEVEPHAKRGRELLPVVATHTARLQSALLSCPSAVKVVEVVHVTCARCHSGRRRLARWRGAGRANDEHDQRKKP